MKYGKVEVFIYITLLTCYSMYVSHFYRRQDFRESNCLNIAKSDKFMKRNLSRSVSQPHLELTAAPSDLFILIVDCCCILRYVSVARSTNQTNILLPIEIERSRGISLDHFQYLSI
jgi:hypothetical protein